MRTRSSGAGFGAGSGIGWGLGLGAGLGAGFGLGAGLGSGLGVGFLVAIIKLPVLVVGVVVASLQVAVVAPAVALEPCLHLEAVSGLRGMCWDQSSPTLLNAVGDGPSELALNSDRPVVAAVEQLG